MSTRGFHIPFVIQNPCNALRKQIPGRDFLTDVHFSDLSPATQCRLSVDPGRPFSCHLTLPHNSTRSIATWGSYVYAVRCVFY